MSERVVHEDRFTSIHIEEFEVLCRDTKLGPEEKLLRAIFSEKAADVKDTSLRLPTGYSGVVVDVQVLVRRGVEKDERTIAIERVEIDRLAKDRDDEKNILENNYKQNLINLFVNKTSNTSIDLINKGNKIKDSDIENKNIDFLETIIVDDAVAMETFTSQKKIFNDAVILLDKKFQNKIEKIQSGDDLLPGVLKVVKIFCSI